MRLSVAILALFITFHSAAAAEKEKKVSGVATKTVTTREISNVPTTIWAGLSTDGVLIRNGSTVPSLSVLIGMDRLQIQTYFNVSSTSPFQFGLGGALKYIVIGDTHRGLTVGGGFGIGTVGTGVTVAVPGVSTTEFVYNFAGMVGIQFQPIDGVLVSADTGMGITGGGGSTQFRIGGHSALLGLSLHLRL